MKKQPNIRLSDIPRPQMPEAPEGFFESFEQELDAMIDEKENAKGKQRFVSMAQWSAVAAAVVVILVSWFLFQSGDETGVSTYEDMLSAVSSDDIIFYLQNTDLDTDMILAEVNPELLLETEVPNLDNISDEDVNLILEEYEDLL